MDYRLDRELLERKKDNAFDPTTYHRRIRYENTDPLGLSYFPDSIFILQRRPARNMSKTRHENKLTGLRRRRQRSSIRQKHREKLQNARKNSQGMRKIVPTPRLRVCPEQIRAYSSVQKSEKIQHDGHHQDKHKNDRTQTGYQGAGSTNRQQTEMGSPCTENSRKNDETIGYTDQDLRVHMESLVLEGQTGLYCGRLSGNDLCIRRMAHTERNREKQKSRDEQAGGHAKQVLANNNGCISGTPIPVLETETHVPSIESHLEELQVKVRYRQRTAGQTRLISSFCKEIERKLRRKAGKKRSPKPTPGMLKHEWAKNRVISAIPTVAPTPHLPWISPTGQHMLTANAVRMSPSGHTKATKAHYKTKWQTN